MMDAMVQVWCEELQEALRLAGYDGPPPVLAMCQPGSPMLGLLYWPLQDYASGSVDALVALETAGYHGEWDSLCVVAVYPDRAQCLTCQAHRRRQGR